MTVMHIIFAEDSNKYLHPHQKKNRKTGKTMVNEIKYRKNALLILTAAACLITTAGCLKYTANAEGIKTMNMPKPVMRANFDKSLSVNIGDDRIEAAPGPGAEFVPSVEGHGIEPGRSGPAAIIPVADKLWKNSGSIAFRFRPSRTIRYRPEEALHVLLADSPVFKLYISEDTRHCVFGARMAIKSARYTHTHNRSFLSHLKGNRWYHAVFSWDAAKGRNAFYLNGQIQQKMREGHPWPAPESFSGDLKMGGTFGKDDSLCRFAIDSVELYGTFMEENQVSALLEGRPNFPLFNEGSWNHKESLDLAPYNLKLLYEENFDAPLNMIREEELFEGSRRVKLPEGRDWVIEGAADAWTENNRCIVRQKGDDISLHTVLWNTREFPGDILIEFGVVPQNPEKGLAIVFFCTRNTRGGSPFDLWMEKRGGEFTKYHSGQLNGYHASYWAGDRRNANLRKNKGFLMPAVGMDRMGAFSNAGSGPHKVRILKVGGTVRIEVNGKISLKFDDDGKTYAGLPVWQEGWIGLRHMSYSEQVSYTHFKVWQAKKK